MGCNSSAFPLNWSTGEDIQFRSSPLALDQPTRRTYLLHKQQLSSGLLRLPTLLGSHGHQGARLIQGVSWRDCGRRGSRHGRLEWLLW